MFGFIFFIIFSVIGAQTITIIDAQTYKPIENVNVFANDKGTITDNYGLCSLDIFKKENVEIRSFFAPNHTYDLNTFKALKESGIKNIIDGYGLLPYSEKGLNFIPQLFYKEIILPFGIQSTQIHLNYWSEEDFFKFEKFVEKNKEKFITFDEAIEKINNNIFSKTTNLFVKMGLRLIRLFTENKKS